MSNRIFQYIPYYGSLLTLILSAGLFCAPLAAGQILFAGLSLLASLGTVAWLHRRLLRQRQVALGLEEQLERLQAWFEGMPHPAFLRDRQGVLQHCNASYLEHFATRRADVIGQSVLQGPLEDPEQAREYHADYMRVIAQEQALQLERPLRVNGRELTVRHWVAPCRDSRGQVRGIVGGWVDITRQRQHADRLEAARQQAEAASQAKTAFLASTGHELRSPAKAVAGLLEQVLQGAADPPAQQPLLARAYRTVRQMQVLIDDTLDIARLESGRLALTPEWLDPQRLVEAILGEFADQARQKNLKLLPAFPCGGEPLEVLLDPRRFRQILGHLLSNAIRFTEQGQIKVRLDLQRATPQQLQLTLRVTDSGIGIDEQAPARLGEPSGEADPLPKPEGPWPGLGLRLCRHLCELMQGTLHLASQPGIGTEARVQLPLACRPRRPPAAPAELPTARAADTLHGLINGQPANLGQPPADQQAQPWHGAFSLKALQSLSRGKPQFRLRILNELLRCSYRDRQQLRELCDAPSIPALAELAHKIKGSALMVQARALEAHCVALERACQEEADLPDLLQHGSALEQAMLMFERALAWQLEQPDSPATS